MYHSLLAQLLLWVRHHLDMDFILRLMLVRSDVHRLQTDVLLLQLWRLVLQTLSLVRVDQAFGPVAVEDFENVEVAALLNVPTAALGLEDVHASHLGGLSSGHCIAVVHDDLPVEKDSAWRHFSDVDATTNKSLLTAWTLTGTTTLESTSMMMYIG